MCTKFLSEIVKKRVHFGSQSVDGKTLINESERKKVLECRPCLYDHCCGVKNTLNKFLVLGK